MSWREEVEPDWFHEAPFYLVAAVFHAALLAVNPVMRWGKAERALDKAVPVEFVTELPQILAPGLAPAPPGDGSDREARRGPGEFEPEKVRAGDPAPPPKAAPSPKPAPPKTAPKPKVAAKPAPDPRAQAAARERAARRAEAAAALRERRAAEERERAAARAEAARLDAERKAEAARLEAERRAEAARLEAEKKAARARRKAELSRALATMDAPDEALSAGGDGAGPAPRPGAAKAGAAAALAAGAGAAPVEDPGDAAGSGGSDLIDAKARGGGAGDLGGGVSWALDGPVGARRALSREAPKSPDWVAVRGLDLTVTVRFQVLPDGSVKPGAAIQKTSGFPDIDRRAVEALRRWRFEPAKPGAPEVWGRVTFRFTS